MSLKYPLPYYVRKTLGLGDFDEYAEKIKDLNLRGYKGVIEDVNRRSGRTTRMLVRAVYFSQNRKVYLKAHNFSYARILHRRAYEMCCRLGISDENILVMPSDANIVGLQFPVESIFIDHYVSERNNPDREDSRLKDFEYQTRPYQIRTNFEPEFTYTKRRSTRR